MLKHSIIVFLSMLLIANTALITLASPETTTPPEEQKITEAQSETPSDESKAGVIEFDYKEILQMQRDIESNYKEMLQEQRNLDEQTIQKQYNISIYRVFPKNSS